MYRRLDHLNGSVIAHVDSLVGGEGNLRETEGAGVRVFGGADDLEDGHHGEGHVWRTVVGAAGAEAHVHVEEGGGMALEPAGLEGDGAAADGPEGAVCCCGHSAAWGC